MSRRVRPPADRPESLERLPPGARRVVSEGSTHRLRMPVSDFPADCPHRLDFHFPHRPTLLRVSDMDEYHRILGVPSIQPSFSPAVTSGGRNCLTTSPQSLIPPSTAPSKRLGHRLRVLPTFVV